MTDDQNRADTLNWIPGTDEDSPETLADLPILHIYTRAHALADGFLIAVPEAIAKEAGFRAPIALTASAWADCVAWSDEDDEKQPGALQDETGRLWDVLWMTKYAIQCAPEPSTTVTVVLHRVPRDGHSDIARETRLTLKSGPGDQGELVLTVMLPDED
ncbi:DUF6573 family protein [Streptomyces sp. SS]|uniref:DUF6573 family protein n=1 Tax=Streptomyces sp. SS TaxID=260742 RepID=UPI0002E4BE32|nr:DUF6573 family protein [Streptomyces sp. SS]